MISRLTAFATAFAILAAATLTFAGAQQPTAASRAAQVKPLQVVQLATVVVVGHRASLAAR